MYCQNHRKCEEDHRYQCWCPCGCGCDSNHYVMSDTPGHEDKPSVVSDKTGLCICCSTGRSHEVPPQSCQSIEDLIAIHESILKYYKKVKRWRDQQNTFYDLAEKYKLHAGVWSSTEFMYQEETFNELLNAFGLQYIKDDTGKGYGKIIDYWNALAVGDKRDLVYLMAEDMMDSEYPFWPFGRLTGHKLEIPEEHRGKVKEINRHWTKWLKENNWSCYSLSDMED